MFLKRIVCFALIGVCFLNSSCSNGLDTVKTQTNPRLKIIDNLEYARDVGDFVITKDEGKYYLFSKNGEKTNFSYSFDDDVNIETLRITNNIGMICDSDWMINYFNLLGESITDKKYSMGSEFNESGYAVVVNDETGLYNIINTEAEVVVEYPLIKQYPANSNIIICNPVGDGENNHYIVLDDSLTPILSDISLFSRSEPTSARIREICLYGNDRYFIYKFDDIYYLFDYIERKIIDQNIDYEVLLDKNNTVDIDFTAFNEYKTSTETFNGLSIAIKDDKKAVVDTQGNLLTDYEYDELSFMKGNVLIGEKHSGNASNEIIVLFDTRFPVK